MQRTYRARYAFRCPVPWTVTEEQAFAERLELLRADIRSAGGLEAWMATRLDAWLDGSGPCRHVPHPHRRPQR